MPATPSRWCRWSARPPRTCAPLCCGWRTRRSMAWSWFRRGVPGVSTCPCPRECRWPCPIPRSWATTRRPRPTRCRGCVTPSSTFWGSGTARSITSPGRRTPSPPSSVRRPGRPASRRPVRRCPSRCRATGPRPPDMRPGGGWLPIPRRRRSSAPMTRWRSGSCAPCTSAGGAFRRMCRWSVSMACRWGSTASRL